MMLVIKAAVISISLRLLSAASPSCCLLSKLTNIIEFLASFHHLSLSVMRREPREIVHWLLTELFDLIKQNLRKIVLEKIATNLDISA